MRAGLRSPWRVLLAVAAVPVLLGLALVTGPLVHAALSATGLTPPYVKVFRYVLVVFLCVYGAFLWKPWRDVPHDLYGQRGPHSRPSLAVWGALVAIVVLAAIALVDAAAGNLTWDPQGPAKLRHRLGQAIARGLTLGLLEELAFRGWAFERLRRGRSALAAAALVSLLFGIVHAFRESDAPRGLPPTVESGLTALSAWGRNLFDLRSFGPSFLGLFLFSMALCGAVLRFRTLWFGVGLHGASVFWLPLHSGMTLRTSDRDWTGSKWLYDGPLGYLALGVLTWILWPRAKAKAPEAPPA